MERKTNSRNQEMYDFNDIIETLQERVINDIYKQEKGKKRKDKAIKTNVFLSKIFGNENAAALITMFTMIVTLFGLGGFLLIKSYNVFHTLSLATNARELSSVLLFISSATSSILGLGCVFNFSRMFDALASFYKYVIVDPLKNALTNSREKNHQKIKQHRQKISDLKNTLISLETMQENFKYLIHSSLKDKLFSEKDIDLLYKNLTSNNITSLIHLIYHGGKQEIKRLSKEEHEKLTTELEQRINIVKKHAQEIAEKSKIENPNQRRRRMERFHTYPYDDKLTDEFSEFIPTQTTKRRS